MEQFDLLEVPKEKNLRKAKEPLEWTMLMPWADAQRLTSIKAQIILHEVSPESVLSELGFEGGEELSPAGHPAALE